MFNRGKISPNLRETHCGETSRLETAMSKKLALLDTVPDSLWVVLAACIMSVDKQGEIHKKDAELPIIAYQRLNEAGYVNIVGRKRTLETAFLSSVSDNDRTELKHLLESASSKKVLKNLRDGYHSEEKLNQMFSEKNNPRKKGR